MPYPLTLRLLLLSPHTAPDPAEVAQGSWERLASSHKQWAEVEKVLEDSPDRSQEDLAIVEGEGAPWTA